MKQPKLRFKGFEDEWKEEKLSKLVERITRKNSKLTSKLPLTISAQYGLVNQLNFFSKVVASKNLKNYILLFNGDFAYNKSYSNGFPYGSIKRLDRYDKGVISSLYIAFRPTNINSNWLSQYYNSPKWYSSIYQCSAEGARNHGLLNISPKDFFNSKLDYPLLSEQNKIGHYFNLLDKMIKLHQDKLKHLKRLKRGYLQKMFTSSDAPRLRFKGFNDNWQKQNLNNISKTFSGGTPKVSNKLFYNGNIPFIRSSEIHKNSTELTITEKGLENSSAKLVHRGTILYALYGATSGQVDLSKISGAINQAILAIQLDNQNNNEFIVKILERLKKKIVSTYLQGGQGNLSAKIIKNIYIKIPSLPEQTKIGHFFALLDKQIELANQKLLTLQKTKKAYLQKMFI